MINIYFELRARIIGMIIGLFNSKHELITYRIVFENPLVYRQINCVVR